MVRKDLPQIGAPILRKRAKSLTLAELRNAKTKKIINDLVDTMREGTMVGMAAPQIGESVRIMVTEIKEGNPRVAETAELQVYINPRIISKSKTTDVVYEGCGSVLSGNIYGPVKRPKNVEVEYDDLEGKRHTLKAGGLLARVIQHELDHLNGILFTDMVLDNKKLLNKSHYYRMMDEGEIK